MRIVNILSAMLFSSLSFATSLSNIVIFGDSLSDTGNFYEASHHAYPQSPPYYEGHFSNGPIWIEYLIKSYQDSAPSHIENYAFGGAAVAIEVEKKGEICLQQEIRHYLQDHHDSLDANSLFVLWIGANNYLQPMQDPDKTVHDVNEKIVASLNDLVAKGAKHILVANLPDLGSSPYALEKNAQTNLGYVSFEHNKALAASIENFQNTVPDVQWIFYDANAAFSEIRTNPMLYGYDNVNESCLAEKTADCSKFFFFDSVHPTTVSHKLLGAAIRSILDNADINFTS